MEFSRADFPFMETEKIRASLPQFSQLLAAGLNHQGACIDQDSQLITAYTQHYQLTFDNLQQHQLGVFESNGFEIVGQIFKPKGEIKGTLFVHHGYFDHAGLYGFPIQLGLNNNYAVAAYDLPGHGLSSGPKATITSFEVYRDVQDDWLKLLATANQPKASNLLPKPWIALGQSTGCAVLIDSLLNSQKNIPLLTHIDGLILLAPLIRSARWYWTRCLYYILRHRGGVARTFGNNSSDLEFVEFLKTQDPLQHRWIEADWVAAMIAYANRIIQSKQHKLSPLVIQGDQDSTVSFRYNLKALKQLFTTPKIHILKGAAHHLVNEAQPIKLQIEAIINDYLQNQPRR